MQTVVIPTKVFFSQGQEINEWLREKQAVTNNLIVHPYDTYTETPGAWAITFEDSELAFLFKLTWG